MPVGSRQAEKGWARSEFAGLTGTACEPLRSSRTGRRRKKKAGKSADSNKKISFAKKMEKRGRKRFTNFGLLDTSLLLFAGNAGQKKILLVRMSFLR